MTRFAGTMVLATLALSTDRVRVAVWSLAIAVTAFLLASRTSSPEVTPELATTIFVPVAVMSVLLVTPHLRGAEQSGRTELANSGVVGRYAHLTAALSSALPALVCTCALLVVALESAGSHFAGSLGLSSGALVVGFFFAALAALTSQFVDDAAAAIGLALVPVVPACLQRTVGPTPPSDALGPVESLIGTVAALVFLVVAYWAAGHRDLGSGLAFRRRQPTPRVTRLAGPASLALREQRWPLLAWTSAVSGISLGAGSLAARAPEFTGADADFESSSALFLVLLTLLAAAYTVSTVMRIVRAEEEGLAGALLSVPLSRSSLFGAHTVVTACAATSLTVIGGFGFAVSAASARSDAGVVWSTLAATLHLLPALAVVIGMAAWCYGHAPRAVNALWGYLAYATVLALFGDELPEWAGILSPFAQLPRLPAETFAAGPPIALAAIGGVFTVLGVEGFRRRDILRSGRRDQSQLGRIGEERMPR